ncbi:DUF2207 domain-containing protein [Glaciibacter flavus]|uniref:DUF2207 domain-containing protein n=1 Tax=Orlajensenia flava TaxID=2565934 RepID=A0A4S4FXJ1_9MICO|nr:DUF2207 domain-containing protein [Glaciibacter flavus]THG35740.1 DUF2207 domain-containing protein [Glaciibacter flavus]
MSNPSPVVGRNRSERILAFMMAGVIGLSILAFIAVIIGTASGMQGPDFTRGVWPAVLIFPLIGFPIGIILLIVFLIMSSVRRSREIRQERS